MGSIMVPDLLAVAVRHELFHVVQQTVENDLLLLLVQVVLILGLSRIMGMLFARMRQPQVIGEMIAGIMLGPSLLGRLSHPTFNVLFPDSGIELLNTLSQLGVIFFLFLVGLEFEMELVRNRGRSTIFTALSSIAVPFVLGFGIGLWLVRAGWLPTEKRLPAALFIGASMSIT